MTTTTPTEDLSGNYEPESTYRAGDVPERTYGAIRGVSRQRPPRGLDKLAFEATMGNTARGRR